MNAIHDFHNRACACICKCGCIFLFQSEQKTSGQSACLVFMYVCSWNGIVNLLGAYSMKLHSSILNIMRRYGRKRFKCPVRVEISAAWGAKGVVEWYAMDGLLLERIVL